MAAIIYWQAKEISRIVKEYSPEEDGIDVSLLAHISPIEWSNVVLYASCSYISLIIAHVKNLYNDKVLISIYSDYLT